VATGPWDLTRAGTPGRNRFLASDADRERAIDLLKTAFVHGVLSKDELALRTGHALKARTYGQLAVITGDLAAEASKPVKPAKPAKPVKPEPVKPAKPAATTPARRRLNKKVVAWGACAIVLPPALGAAFLSYYGGFLVMFLLTCIGTVVCCKPPARPRSMSGRR
jgi:hypothetical protein